MSKPTATLPAFTPVPRQKDRSNGWKPEVQRAFIEALAETGSVRAACRRVGRSECGAYQMRRHPEGGEFREAWAAALDIGIQRIEDVAMDRALNGVEVPVYAYGKVIGQRRVYNDRLLMFLLRNRAPQRFAAHRSAAFGLPDKAELERLKQQWRAEWQREEDEDEEDVRESINRFIDDMAARRRANMSPRARAAFDEAERIRQEDGIEWQFEGEDLEGGDLEGGDLEDGDDDGPQGGENQTPAAALPAPGETPPPEHQSGQEPEQQPEREGEQRGPRVWNVNDNPPWR